MRPIRVLVWMMAFVGIWSRALANDEIPPMAGATVHLTPAERAWLDFHREVRWGVDPNWPPFSSFDRNDQMIGIDADITRLVAARVGLRLTIVRAASWSEVLLKASAGDVDFLSATARFPERVERFDFTDNYGSFPVVIITRNEAPFLTLMPNLGTLTIAAERDGVVTLQLEQEFPMAHFVLTDNSEEALKHVALREADVTVQNLAVACRVIHLDGLSNLKISGVSRYNFPIHFAVRKDAPELRSILDKGLATITPDEQDRIYAAHLTPDVAKARDWGMWRRRSFDSALIGATVIGLVLIWNRFQAREIQRRRAAEAALLNARDRIEAHARQLDRRVREVEQLNSELTAANQNLDSFSASVSHDLRAPLRRVIAFTGLLQKASGTVLTGEARTFMTAIVQESTGMDRLIQDMLEFSRLGRAELHRQSVSMRQLVENVIAGFQTRLQQRAVIWKIGELGEVFGDPNLLRYALANLIDNAIKYSALRAETRITIDIDSESTTEREAAFLIRDNGCGLDMKHAKRIFEPFQRLHTSAEYDGSGVGLASARRIIQKHGGRIWVESEPDKGATFYFTLPRPPLRDQ